MNSTRHDTGHDHMACPACGRTYAIGSDEYCPHDGERLELRPGAAAVEAPEPAVDPSRLEGILSRMGLRKRSAPAADRVQDVPPAATGRASLQGEPVPGPEDGNDPLPPQVLEKGWQVSGPLESGEAMDMWQVVRTSEAAGPSYARFYRFRARVLTTPALYTQLYSHSCSALPTLLDHGTVSLKGHARASFELVLLPNRQSLRPLRTWLDMGRPSEAKALDLLPHLVDMLARLSAAGVQPISFSVAQLLRNELNGQIMLDNLAALIETDRAHTDYRPELDQNALLSRLWSAPELAEQLVVSPKGAIFCVGQVLAVALWGQALDVAALRAGNLAFASIADVRLARILQGCLWVENIQGRWDLQQLQASLTAPLDQLPPVEDWAQLGPRAMGKSFALAGRTYWRVEDLLGQAVMPHNWKQATARLGPMLDWIESGSPWASVATHLRNQWEAGRSPDHVLIQLARTVNPGLPLTWRGLDLSDDHVRASLVNLAQRNLATDTTAEEAEMLEALFQADLRGAFTIDTHAPD